MESNIVSCYKSLYRLPVIILASVKLLMIGEVTLGTWVRLNNGFENDCTNEVKVVLFLSPDGCDITFVIDLNA